MDHRIDVTKRKPRRLRGTPAHSFINRASLIVLGVGVAIGIATTLPFPLVEDLKKKYNFDLAHVSEKEKERRLAFTKTLSKPKTSQEILEILAQNEKLEEEK